MTTSDVVYVSEARIEPLGGPIRAAHLPAEAAPTLYGVHGEVAEHYAVPPGAFPEHATTLDHVVAATAG